MTAALKTALTENELEKALEGCAKEPIHIPGAIQPHGILFAISETDMTIRQASANMNDFIGKPVNALIDRPISDVIGEPQTRMLKKIVTSGELQPVKSTVFTVKTGQSLRSFDVVAHRSEGHLILEMEPAPKEEKHDDLQQFYDRLRNFSVNLREADTLEKLNQTIVNEIRDLTGIDRVKLYKFDENWNGSVIAESKADHMPSYLGLHFPASDIPEQARKLFSKSYLRLICDIHYDPVPIVPTMNPATGNPTDLSLSTLRSVSPVHIQYLDNMKIRASMTVSIIQNQKLWGLVACHHNEEKYISYRTRMAAELTGHIFSSHLSTLEESEKSDIAQRQQLLLAQISAALAPEKTLRSVLKARNGLFQQAMDADSLICRIDREIYGFGETPPKAALKKILNWLDKNHPDKIFSTISLGEKLDLSAKALPLACGMLAVPVGNDTRDYVLWFRKEITRQINWAGKPEKKISMDSAGFRLTPRGSFELWKENVGGTAPKWTDEQEIVAGKIAQMLLEKKVKDELRQHEADLETIMENSSAFIYMKDEKGRYLFANQSTLDMLGKEMKDILHKTDRDLFPAKIARKIQGSDAKVFKTSQSMTLEETFPTDKRNYHMITVKFPLYNSEGEMYALCSIATDISERKEAEQMTRKYAKDLERSNQELDEFAYIASHDLKEPLRGIHNLSSFLIRDYEDKLDDEGKRKLSRLMDLSKRMSTLINDLLYYSRIGRSERAIQETNLNDVIEDIRHTLPSLDDEHVHLDMPVPLPTIVCDTTRVTELFRNLISNAVKYNDSPEKRIEIGWLEEKKGRKKEPVFTVKDNGIGIAEDMYDEIFRIFKRLHKPTAYGGGTGSGLTFVKKIVERHQGRIWLESEPGKGTTFYFTLPGEKLGEKT